MPGPERNVAAGAAPEADLTGWTVEPFTAAGFTHDVYRKGEGPGVVLIPEMPGIHPGVLALGNYLVDNGFTVACPSLYGTPGAPGMRLGAVPPGLDEAALSVDLTEFVVHYANQPANAFDLAGALTEMIEIVQRYHIALPSTLAMLIKVLVMLEGMSGIIRVRRYLDAQRGA